MAVFPGMIVANIAKNIEIVISTNGSLGSAIATLKLRANFDKIHYRGILENGDRRFNTSGFHSQFQLVCIPHSPTRTGFRRRLAAAIAA